MPTAFRPLSGLRTIRHKLAVILALPTGALVVLAGLGTASQAGRSAAAGHISDQVAVITDTHAFVGELQRERGLTAGLLGGEEGFRAKVAAQRVQADSARATLDRQLEGNTPGADAVRTALGKLSGLSSVRGRADTATIGTTEELAFYTDAVTALTDAAFAGSNAAVSDDQLRADLATLRSLGDATEAAALERGTLNGVLAAGTFRGEDYPSFVRILAAKSNALTQVGRTASGSQQAALDAALRTQAATSVSDTEQQVLSAYRATRLPVKAADWWNAASTLVDSLHAVQTAVAADSRSHTAELRSAAERQLALDAALALLAICGAILLGVAATRSITRPLGELSREADELADRTLPESVARVRDAAAGEDPAEIASSVSGAALAGSALAGSPLPGRRDEIAQVATALNRVAGTALRLAVEQTVLQRNSTESLANLGRRNQNLVTRQLGFLSSLERGEHDPGVLANLFELDHLATRMRRNAESILVLVGERSPRRWARPIAMGDVIRAALGEVEDYRRVALRQVDEALVDGGAVAEVAHLLAELIENALAASAPDTDVELYARAQGPDYLVAIVDHGHGLTEQELAAANLRLSGAESFLVGRTKLLGHYVVGRLADRLGARVRLAPSPVAGVTASVLLPGLLFGAPSPGLAHSGAAR
ncbi:nitrate- and nitrite sensing domain-containing protein [Streptacidiphilus sp. MAP12-16]|uniref:sensor histidine kinase n=1 Tax=Streptacidiphilus sp. MAP12-16 TaxID=3156300 RepID=UPI003517AF85